MCLQLPHDGIENGLKEHKGGSRKGGQEVVAGSPGKMVAAKKQCLVTAVGKKKRTF